MTTAIPAYSLMDSNKPLTACTTDYKAVHEEDGITYIIRSNEPLDPHRVSFGAKWKANNDAQYGFWFCVPLTDVCDAVAVSNYRQCLRDMARERRESINGLIASGTLTADKATPQEVPAPAEDNVKP